MPIRVDIDEAEVRRLTGDFAVAASEIGDEAADLLDAAGVRIVKTARALAPVDTGTLRGSIRHTVNRRQQRLTVGPLGRARNPKSGQRASAYARYVERGTSRQAPQPFMEPAVRKHTGPGSRLMRGLARAGVTPIDRSLRGGP